MDTLLLVLPQPLHVAELRWLKSSLQEHVTAFFEDEAFRAACRISWEDGKAIN